MKYLLIIFMLISFICKSQINGFNFNSLQSKVHPKYGINIGNDTFSIPTEVHMAKSLGVNYFRYRMFVTQWDGTDNAFQKITDSGMQIVLNIRYKETTPNDYPQNLLSYGDTVRMMLDKYQPDLVVVENEQFNPQYYNVVPPQYIAMLQTVSPIVRAHVSSSGKPLKLTDGGTPSTPLYILTYRWLQANIGQSVADTFGNRCLLTPGQINAAKNPCSNMVLENKVAEAQLILDAAKNGIIDYVNWHDKEPWNPNFDTTQYASFTQITRYVLRYLKMFINITTGKPLITNETGQKYNTQPLLVTRLLQEFYNEGIEYCIWYSGDSQDGAGAKSLFNANGSIRPNGVAFQTFIYALSHLSPP